MDPTKVKAYDDNINNGSEMAYRSLIQQALQEGNEAIASWLVDKVKGTHEATFKDIIEDAVHDANVESATQKPTDLAKKYWNEYFPEAEQKNIDPAGEAILGKLTPDNTNDLYTERDAADKIKDTIKTVVSNARKLTPDGLPEDDDHFGEEQAAGLAELLNGLREGPNDTRW